MTMDQPTSIMQMFLALFDKIVNYPKCLSSGKEALDRQELDKASKYYQKVIKHLGKRVSLENTLEKYLGEAFLGQGNVCVARQDNIAAFDWYDKAIDNAVPISNLPVSAIALLGDTFSSKRDLGERAIEIYLRYVTLKSDTTVDKIYAILEEACVVDENQDPHKRKKAFALNQRVLSINKGIDWTCYYLGIGAYLENDKATAKDYLLRSAALNETKALTFYWLGKTFGDFNESALAVQYFLKFTELVFDREASLKQAEAYSYLGSTLIKSLGGFSDTLDLSINSNLEILEKAVLYFERASLANEKDGNVLFNLARTFACLNRHERAVNIYEKAIILDNKNAEYFYYLAVELEKVAKYQDAIKNLVSALHINDHHAYHHLLARLYLLARNYTDAERECRECIRMLETNHAHDGEIVCILTYALYYQTKYHDLINICEKYPSNLTFSDKYLDTYYFIARAYSNECQFDKAIEWYTKFAEIDGCESTIYYLGCALANKGDYEKALAVFARCMTNETKYQALAYLQCAIVYTRINQSHKAEEHYIKAYTIDTKNIQVLYSAGLFYYHQGENEKALKHLSELLDIDSSQSAARFIRAHINERQGDISSAATDYELLLDNTKFGLLSHLRLGILHFKQSDYKKAFKYLHQAYRAEDKNDSILFYYGLVSALANKFELALESWHTLIDRHSEDERLRANIYRVHYLLGVRHVKEDKLLLAVEEWKEYLKGYTDDLKTKRNIAELYFRLFVEAIVKGDTEKAKGFLMQADTFEGDNSKYSYYIALCDYKSGMIDECIDRLTNLLDKEPTSSHIKYHKGLALMKKGERASAIDFFREILDSDENNEYSSHANWMIANEYILNREYEEAIPILEALL